MKIRGIPVGAAMPRANWEQTDETMADFIQGKEIVEAAIGGAAAAAETAHSAAQRAHTAAEAASAAAEEAKAAARAAEEKKLVFHNVAAGAFEEIGDDPRFPYRAVLPLSEADAAMIPEVIFSLEDAGSGIFAPVAESFDGGVYLFAAELPERLVTVPTVLLWKGAV